MEISSIRILSNNVEINLDRIAKEKVAGYNLEEARLEQLEVTDDNLDESVSRQPMCISYFTACLSSAKRNLDSLNFEYELWRKEKHFEIKKNATTKIAAAEMEVKIDVENKEELMKWQSRLNDAQQLYDNAESIYEGWKQKGFALNQHAKLKNQDFVSNNGGSISGKNKGAFPESFKETLEKVRILQKKTREEEYNNKVEQE